MSDRKYCVKVTTGKAKGAGTDATIKITLTDHEGKNSEEKVLDKHLPNEFEYGKVDTYTVSVPKGFGKFISNLFLCLSARWWLDSLSLNSMLYKMT